MQLLVSSYNPAAAEGLMCRDTLSIGWDGRVYDCDFNQQLEIGMMPPPARDSGRAHTTVFDLEVSGVLQRACCSASLLQPAAAAVWPGGERGAAVLRVAMRDATTTRWCAAPDCPTARTMIRVHPRWRWLAVPTAVTAPACCTEKVPRLQTPFPSHIYSSHLATHTPLNWPNRIPLADAGRCGGLAHCMRQPLLWVHSRVWLWVRRAVSARTLHKHAYQHCSLPTETDQVSLVVHNSSHKHSPRLTCTPKLPASTVRASVGCLC